MDAHVNERTNLSLDDLTTALSSGARGEEFREKLGLSQDELLAAAEKLSNELSGSVSAINMV